MIGGKFAPLTLLDEDDTEVDTLIKSFNTAMTETASGISSKGKTVKNRESQLTWWVYATNEEHWWKEDTRQQMGQKSTEQLTRKLIRA